MKKMQKTYGSIFKEKAVLLSYECDNLSQLEKELEITKSSLCKWRKEYQKFGSTYWKNEGIKLTPEQYQKFDLATLGIKERIKLTPEQLKIQELEEKIEECELKFEILKKGNKYIFQGRKMLYYFITTNEEIYTIEKMCEVLGVTKCSYYQWKKKRIISEKRKQIILLKEEIKSIFFNAKERYGSTRIAIELQIKGYKISRYTVSFYMKQLGLSCTVMKKNSKNK